MLSREGRAPNVGRIAIFIAKFAVTFFCFWYFARKIDLATLVRAAHELDLEWAGLAVLVLLFQLPLVGLRWSKIVDALANSRDPISRMPMVGITAVANFFGQITPNVIAETVRVWLFTRLGYSWRRGFASVVLDRAIAILALVMITLLILLLPFDLAMLGGHRTTLLELFGGLLA